MRKQFIFSQAISLCVTIAFLYPIFKASRAYGSEALPEAREEIQKIETKLSTERERLRAFGRREKQLLSELTTMEKAVVEKRGALEALKRKARLHDSEIERLKEDRNRSKQTVQDIESRLSIRLIGLYKYARKGYLKALVDVGDIAEFWRRVEYLDRVMKNERDILLELADERRRQGADMSTVTARLNEIEGELKRENARLSTLNRELEDKVLQLTKIHREKEFLMTTVRELQRASENVRQTLLHIENRQKPVERLPARFIDHKGLLPSPLAGNMIRDETHDPDAKIGLYDGVFIEGSPGAGVKAVFPGRVAFSGQVKGYGDLIIVDHGSRFFTVSAHLSRRDKSEGDVVAEGEVLGAVGERGGNLPGRVYFEVRKGGTPLDPLEWLKKD